jgi:hypothetical protein
LIKRVIFVIQKDRICGGDLEDVMEEGIITEWLLLLEDIDGGA